MAQTEKARQIKRKRVSKDDWLATALRLLWLGGINAVQVERLASELKVNKSGFYYHFNDRDALHAALLDYWIQLDQQPIALAQSMPYLKPADILRLIADVVDREDLNRFDSAIRQWARQDRRVQRVWRRQMNRRIDFVRSQFLALGYIGDDLEARTRVFVAYQAVERNLFSDLTTEDRKRLREHRFRFLLPPLE